MALLERAQQRAGVSAADEPGALVNLRLLLASCRRSAALNQVGEEVLEKVVVRHLVNAVRLADHVNRHPDLLAAPPAVALVITGLPRTGTTVLHKLAALDPSNRVLRLWEALSPVPPDPAGADAGSRSSRVRSAEAWLERYLELVPEMR
ncbi:MAG: sulfotransferase, partial [Actinomycetota bacterium]|nr:sulfotransferase [Actinomycetota bacterium]